MNSYVDTNVEPLYKLKHQLERFREQTEYMQMFTDARLDEFEREIKQTRDYICSGDNNNTDDEDFFILWNQYENCRDIFTDRVKRLLQHEIVNREGQRNLYTLISILETYLGK